MKKKVVKEKKPKKVVKEKKCTYKGNCLKHGMGFGSALAIVLSFTRNGSILWAIIHGILSWIYVIFRIIQVWGWI